MVCFVSVAGMGVPIRGDGNFMDSWLTILHKFKDAKYNVEVCSWLFGLVKAGVGALANRICLNIETEAGLCCNSNI